MRTVLEVDDPLPGQDCAFNIIVPWGLYPVRIWRPKNRDHGDLTTDVAFVLSKIGKDAGTIV